MITKFIRFVVGSGVFLMFAGCYTQFAVVDKAVPETIKTVVDSAGDTIKVIERTDTVLQKEHEVCVWERDLMGYPRLRCYKSFYPQDWFVYKNTPWWYRNDPFWADFDRCPRYYYYDSDCGCCRYSTNRYDYFDRDHHYNGGHNGGYSGGNGSGGGGSGNTNPPVNDTKQPSQNRNSRTTAVPVQVQPQSTTAIPKVAVENEKTNQVTQPEIKKNDSTERNIRPSRSR